MNRFIIVFLLVITMTNPVLAVGPHWAEKDLAELKAVYGIEVNGDPDRPPDVELQRELFHRADLFLTPEAGLKRYSLIYAMTEALELPKIEKKVVDDLLSGFIDKCDY